jgi:hypothetical protein
VAGTDIFLSYARTDRASARLFAQAFVDEGFSVWWDGSLHSGETFDEVIEQELRHAKAVVVLWSPRSVASRWVRAEATQADRLNKHAPAIIEPCDRPIIFELTHAADLWDWAGDITDMRWRAFVDDIRRLVDAPTSRQVPVPRRPAKLEPLRGKDAGKIFGRAPAETRRPEPRRRDAVIMTDVDREPTPHHLHTDDIPLRQSSEIDADREVHCLQLEDGELGKQLFVIDSSGVKIGRTTPADVVLSHKSVSREHCVIGLANDELLVTDLSSTNGTYIDDVRVTRATILPVGSVVQLGQVALRHVVHTQAEAERLGRVRTKREGALLEGGLAATS